MSWQARIADAPPADAKRPHDYNYKRTPADFQGEGHLEMSRLRHKWFALTQLTQLRFRLPQPVRHAHMLEHRRRGRQLVPSLLAIVRATIEVS